MPRHRLAQGGHGAAVFRVRRMAGKWPSGARYWLPSVHAPSSSSQEAKSRPIRFPRSPPREGQAMAGSPGHPASAAPGASDAPCNGRYTGTAGCFLAAASDGGASIRDTISLTAPAVMPPEGVRNLKPFRSAGGDLPSPSRTRPPALLFCQAAVHGGVVDRPKSSTWTPLSAMPSAHADSSASPSAGNPVRWRSYTPRSVGRNRCVLQAPAGKRPADKPGGAGV